MRSPMSFLSASDGVYALYAPMEGLLLAFVFEAALRGFVAQTAVRSDFSFFLARCRYSAIVFSDETEPSA